MFTVATFSLSDQEVLSREESLEGLDNYCRPHNSGRQSSNLASSHAFSVMVRYLFPFKSNPICVAPQRTMEQPGRESRRKRNKRSPILLELRLQLLALAIYPMGVIEVGSRGVPSE